MSLAVIASPLLRDRRLLAVWDKVQAASASPARTASLLFETDDLLGLGPHGRPRQAPACTATGSTS